jgi:hypothetical protein
MTTTILIHQRCPKGSFPRTQCTQVIAIGHTVMPRTGHGPETSSSWPPRLRRSAEDLLCTLSQSVSAETSTCPQAARDRPVMPRSVAVIGRRARRKRLASAALCWLRSFCPLQEGGRPWTATTTPEHPFEPTGKRRRGFPLASLALSGAIASSASTPNSSRNSAGTTCARAARVAAFRRCCRGTGRFDGAQADYYVRDR